MSSVFHKDTLSKMIDWKINVSLGPGQWRKDGGVGGWCILCVCVCVFDPGMIKSEGEAGNDASL